MLRKTVALSLALLLLPRMALAQATPPPALGAAPSQPDRYTTAGTEIGKLLDDPAARAVLDKDVPGLTANGQIEMARGMTLRAIQSFVPDTLTDAVLSQVDADLAKLSVQK
jgi:para-nitrobenzyl esterase